MEMPSLSKQLIIHPIKNVVMTDELIILPYFEPNLNQCSDFLDKLKIYLTFS